MILDSIANRALFMKGIDGLKEVLGVHGFRTESGRCPSARIDPA
jgi:hypothetical protein